VAEVAAAVAESVTFARDSPMPVLADVYENMFSNPINYPPQDVGGRHHE
jgi:hypothetical protein